MAKRRRATKAKEQNRMADLIDDLREFEKFKEELLPAIKKDLQAGMTAAQLREKYLSLVQARQLTAALTSLDDSHAANACQKILDRQEGKAKETKEVTHKLENLGEDELNALIKSEIEDSEEFEEIH